MVEPQLSNTEPRRLGELATAVYRAAGAIGLAGLAGGVALGCVQEASRERFFFAYLTNFMFFLSLSLGGLFFVLLQHATRAGWSVVTRRLSEAAAANMILLAVLLLPILGLGMKALYPWARPEALSDPALLAKRAYLNVGFFTVRCAVYFAIWIWLTRYYFRLSVEQDATGHLNLTHRMERLSPAAIILFSLTTSWASFDLLMSLEPRWYSTIFGVYYFAGCVLGFLALLALGAALIQASGRLRQSITPEHHHDIGKLIFAFVVFWGYIAFAQYFLIWYANLPEETIWVERRQTGQWVWASLILLFGQFFVPFFALLSRWPKRRPALLALAAAWTLAAHWLDMYWLVMPEVSPGRAVPCLLDAALFLGMGGLFVAATARRLRACSLIPERDPRLGESLAFENY